MLLSFVYNFTDIEYSTFQGSTHTEAILYKWSGVEYPKEFYRWKRDIALQDFAENSLVSSLMLNNRIME